MPLPIDRPQKIMCVSLNYRDHAEVQGTEIQGDDVTVRIGGLGLLTNPVKRES